MGLLKRGELQHPVLQQETVEVPELGGEVVVRGLRLSERLSITAASFFYGLQGFLRILVGTNRKDHLVTGFAIVARQDIGSNGRIGVTNMRGGINIIDWGSDEFFSHGNILYSSSISRLRL